MSFSTIEVPPSGRAAWLDAFSAQHSGWLASLDVISSEIGAQPLFTNQPLIGISLDRAAERRVVITAGKSDECVTHVVEAPAQMWIERTEAGADVALGIDAADGTRAILRFRTAAVPETVDGIA